MPSQVKRGRGRPPHQPNNQSRQLVEVAAAHAVPQTEISRLLGINEKTLRLYYRPELDCGMALAEAELTGNLLRAAKGRGAPALKASMFSPDIWVCGTDYRGGRATAGERNFGALVRLCWV